MNERPPTLDCDVAGDAGRAPDRLTPNRSVELFVVGDAAVLFDAARQRLFRADWTVATTWSQLVDGKEPFDIVVDLTARHGIPAAFILQSLAHLKSLGLVNGEPGSSGTAWPGRPFADVDRHAPPPSDRSAAFCDTTGFTLGCRILDASFLVETASPEFHRLLASVLRGPAERDARRLRLVEASGAIVLVDGGTAIGRSVTPDGLVPMVIGALVDRAIRGGTAFGALHASAVRHRALTLLLIGESGAGKSTLAAALAASGFDHLADDTVAMAAPGGRILPVATPPNVKSGAWDVLLSRCPELEDAPAHRRHDGERLKYLPHLRSEPPRLPAAPLNADILIFPDYLPGAAVSIRPLAPVDALAGMLASFYPNSGRLASEELSEMIRWIERAEAYRICGGSLDRMVASVEELCR